MDSDRWEFYEENFQQGRRDLLHQIHRRKPSAPPAGQVARTAIEVRLSIAIRCLWWNEVSDLPLSSSERACYVPASHEQVSHEAFSA